MSCCLVTMGLDIRQIQLGCNGWTVGCSTSTEADCKFENRRDTGFPRTETRGIIYMENDQQDKGNKRSKGNKTGDTERAV